MAKKARVDLNGANIRKILRSQKVEEDVRRRANAMKQRAQSLIENPSREQEDYVVHVQPTRTRARAVVITASIEAIADEAKNKSLTKSIDAGRS